MDNQKFRLQESQYSFPYHHIPSLAGENFSCCRTLNWGHEYMCYVRHVAELAEKLAPASVLEVGCGDGRVIGTISEKVPNCSGLDLADRAIAFAKAFYPNVTFEALDANSLDAEFDLVLAIEVLEHIPDNAVGGFLRTLWARCKKGGSIVLSVPTTVLPVSRKHFRHYDEGLLAEQIRSAGLGELLENAEFEWIYHEPAWFQTLKALFLNRYWIVTHPPVQRWLWRISWRDLRFAPKGRGRHLVARLRKP